MSVDGPSTRAYIESILASSCPNLPASETYALVVDDLNNRGQLAVGRSSVDECNSADLHESPCRCLDLCVTHCS